MLQTQLNSKNQTTKTEKVTTMIITLLVAFAILSAFGIGIIVGAKNAATVLADLDKANHDLSLARQEVLSLESKLKSLGSKAKADTAAVVTDAKKVESAVVADASKVETEAKKL